MKKREKALLVWYHHLISVTLFICINVLAIGVSRRNSDLSFNQMRNGGLLVGGDERRLRLMNQDESSSRKSSFFLNYYNNNLGKANVKQLRAGLSPLPLPSNSNRNNQVMRLRDNNNDNYENSISRRSNLISSTNSISNINSVSGSGSSQKTYIRRQASVNSILRLDPSRSLWDASSIICHSVPGLTKEQMELCLRTPDTTSVALEGLQMATEECAHQMRTHRWNCSSLQGTVNPHNTQMLQKGYRESAFGHSIAAAGVAYAVAKACSQGKLLNCGCGFQYDDQINYFPIKSTEYAFDESNAATLKKSGATSWKWAGCSHNMNYGMKFAKLFLDSREKATDLPSRTNLHNNRVGRLAVAENMEIRCKCHGLSGSCELRTCWRSAPSFRKVGTELKNKFRRAIMIDRSNFGNRPMSRLEYNHESSPNMLIKKEKQQQQQRRKRDRGGFGKKLNKRSSKQHEKNNIDLWYYEKSPTYCESNADFDIPGTSGRRCNRTSSIFALSASASGKDAGSCNTLCCGRGYNTIRQVYTTRCNCQFLWCCQVTCQNCTVDEWITVCK